MFIPLLGGVKRGSNLPGLLDTDRVPSQSLVLATAGGVTLTPASRSTAACVIEEHTLCRTSFAAVMIRSLLKL